MTKNLFFIFVITAVSLRIYSQNNSLDTIQKIEEVVIQSQRLGIPFSNRSHTISVISSETIKMMGITSLDEVLQQVVGVDVRRRGIDGMQSDLYIRGGNFNQTLLLIDGIKMDDLQSGHHIMNGLIAIDNIERIEIIRGAASRIYGQNAMNGVINIVTKKIKTDQTKLSLKLGSFQNYGLSIGTQKKFKDAAVQLFLKQQKSDGYRYNTDFSNLSAFVKTTCKDYELLFSYGQRKFGANGFYASPDYKDQYEETQTHLLAFNHQINKDTYTVHSVFYWRRNRDMYVFIRDNPDFYKNLHINNRVGASIDVSLENKWGETGIGMDFNKGFLESNNLGDHNRSTLNMFLEHRFQWLDSKLDITPGIALSYYSDFKFFTYPGIDVGYRFSNYFKFYANLGFTSRIPTYTNLYYESPAEEGNANLKPERALTYDVGFYYNPKKYQINLAYFSRNSKDLIDWTKVNEADKWQASNYNQTLTRGIELSGKYAFKILAMPQKIHMSATKMDDEISDDSNLFSRYALSSFKHRVTLGLQSDYSSALQSNLSYAYTERIVGEKYHLLSFMVRYTYKHWQLNFDARNILNEEYTETNLVPMPKFNIMSALSFTF